MKPFGGWLKHLSFSGAVIGIAVFMATSSSAEEASPVPVEAPSSQIESGVENSEANSPSVGANSCASLPCWGDNFEMPSKPDAVVESSVSVSGITSKETQLSQAEPTPPPQAAPKQPAQNLDLSPEIIENSPVLQRWLRQVPNVLEEIRNDPSFRTRLRVGYSQFPSTGQAGGFNVGVEDVFLGRTGLTVSGDYQRSFNGKREAYGGDLRYYVLPLGSYINIAPQVGYRNLTTGKFSTDGINVGARLMLALSRTGAADVSITQSFVSPGSNEEVGITTLSFGYAVTRNLRLSTDIQKQNSREDKDSRVGIVLEWMP
jgi:hypothetical protein